MDFRGNLYLYLLTSTVGGIGFYALMLSLFRLKFRKHIWSNIIFSVIISLLTLLLHDEGDGYIAIAPLIWLLATLFFLVRVLKIRFVWALVVAFIAYAFYLLLAGVIVLGLPNGFFRPQELHDHFWNNYLLDGLSGMISFAVAALFEWRNWGFRFEFAKVQLWESYIVVGGAFVVICSTMWIIHSWHLIWAAVTGWVVLSGGLAAYLMYARKEERKQNEILKSGMWWIGGENGDEELAAPQNRDQQE